MPPLQRTASCLISPLAGVRAASTGPTNPAGADAAWQSRHAAGCVASEACSRPGKKDAVAAPAWQVLHAIDCGTLALPWNIGIGSVSVCEATATIEVPTQKGTPAATATSCAGSRAPSGVPTPLAQSPPGRAPDGPKYLAYEPAATVAWWHEKQSAV